MSPKHQIQDNVFQQHLPQCRHISREKSNQKCYALLRTAFADGLALFRALTPAAEKVINFTAPVHTELIWLIHRGQLADILTQISLCTSSLVQIISCHLLGAKALSEPIGSKEKNSGHLYQYTISTYMKINLRMLAARCQPFCLDLNVLKCRPYCTLEWNVSHTPIFLHIKPFMMTSSNENIFRVTGPLCGEFTGPRWIPHTRASDAELWCFPWSASE